MSDESEAIVIDLGKSLIELIRQQVPAWEKAFFRFSSEGFKSGSNGSYVCGSKVSLIDPFKSGRFFEHMNSKSARLFQIFGKDKGVLLLSVDPSFNCDIKFEWVDLSRWEITKRNGGTGIPAGI